MRSSRDVAAEALAQSERQARALAARREQASTKDTPPARCHDAADSAARDAERPAVRTKICSVSRVMGHGSRYCEVLLRRPGWKLLESEKWFEDDKHNQYYCPSGRRLVDFCDEMHFSRLAMYLKGRNCIENKARLAMLVPSLMPETFHIQDRQWVGGPGPEDKEGDLLPWFVKEADGNEGTFVECSQKASQCMDCALPGKSYVVQQHLRDPMLYEGRKFHLRLYGLILCLDDGKTWRAYSWQDGYLNIAPTQWAPDDTSRDTQVVIYRSHRIGDWKPWPELYPKFQASFATAIEQAVAQGGLEGRPAKKQFEIAGLDYMVDEKGDLWLIEINMGPVLRDAQLDPECNDDEMVTRALEIVIPWQDPPNAGQWDLVGEFIGADPTSPAIPTTADNPPEPEEAWEEDANMDDDAVADILAFMSDLS